MSRFVVATEAIPTVRIPLHLAWNLVKYFPADKIVTTFHHQTNRVVVMFPGWNAPIVQKILDDLDNDTATGPGRFASWPGLHASHGQEADVPSGLGRFPEDACEQEGLASGAPCEIRFASEELGARRMDLREESLLRGTLAEMRVAMEELTQAQQNKLSALVCDLLHVLGTHKRRQ